MKIFTIKSYYGAYKEYIISSNLSETYMGFYNFKKFIFWLADKIPEEENIIVLVKGEPVYIMSEMAYNLYPVDIKFVDISSKKELEIINEIQFINSRYSQNYRYIIAFSGKDGISSKNFTLVDKYKEDAGFVYRFESSSF